MNTFRERYNRHLGVITIVGLVLLLCGFDIVVIAMRGLDFDDLHTPLGRFVVKVASQFTPAPMPNRAGTERNHLTVTLYLAATLLQMALFALLAWRRVRVDVRRSAITNRLLLVAQLLLCLVGNDGMRLAFSVEVALVLPLWRGLAWVLAHMLPYVAIRMLLQASAVNFSDNRLRLGLLYLGMEVVMHVIVFGVVHLAARERRGRRVLAAAHAELLATQFLLGDMVRDSERLRIARDLHDSVGHHLTALKLHLDLAVRQSNAPVSPSLHTAGELAGELLAEVRAVVSTERHTQRIDLRHALLTLCAGIPAPAIALRIDAALDITTPALAHTLFCCAQEAISNAVRHAGATTLTIDIAQGRDAWTMLAADDGRGSGQLTRNEGNGLRGMRERLALLGGFLVAGDRKPRGYALQITLPFAGGAR
ncbi:sensor histidine kinase [Massilia sp. S19_KUP03_FR1]|uniref:sensor histidine kinase n=1 Tax=Massilia sp. S19_KUP03_FR1 TaxID=3025503 RepID=UPI002FCDBF6F